MIALNGTILVLKHDDVELINRWLRRGEKIADFCNTALAREVEEREQLKARGDFPEKSQAETLLEPYGFEITEFVDEEKLYVLVATRRHGVWQPA